MSCARADVDMQDLRRHRVALLEELRHSGTALGLVVADVAPAFSLADAHGRAVEQNDRLQAGPVVLVFYRGTWRPARKNGFAGLQASTAPLSRSRRLVPYGEPATTPILTRIRTQVRSAMSDEAKGHVSATGHGRIPPDRRQHPGTSTSHRPLLIDPDRGHGPRLAIRCELRARGRPRQRPCATVSRPPCSPAGTRPTRTRRCRHAPPG